MTARRESLQEPARIETSLAERRVQGNHRRNWSEEWVLVVKRVLSDHPRRGRGSSSLQQRPCLERGAPELAANGIGKNRPIIGSIPLLDVDAQDPAVTSLRRGLDRPNRPDLCVMPAGDRVMIPLRFAQRHGR
jgi:hypothetical protein